MRLVKNWKYCLKMWSVRLSLLYAAIPPVWIGMPQEYRDAVLDTLGLKGMAALITFLCLVIIAARVKNQDLPPGGP